MTLVVAQCAGGVPTVFGDILVSMDADNPRARPVALSTLGPEHSRVSADGQTIATHLHQKVVIIAPNCAFGIADRPAACMSALNDLKLLASRQPLTMANVEHFLKNAQQYDKYLGASLVGVVVEGTRASVVYLRPDAVDSQHPLAIAGGGGEFFQEKVLRNLGQPVGPTGLAAEVARAASFCATLLAIENSSGLTIEEGFGAGYEIAYYDAELHTFIKVPQFTFGAWVVGFDPRKGLLGCSATHIAQQQYFDSSLMIRGHRLVRNHAHRFEKCVPPLRLKGDPPARIQRYPMESFTKFGAHTFAILLPPGVEKSGMVPTFTLFGFNGVGGPVGVTVEQQADGLIITPTSDFREQIRRQVEEYAVDRGWA